MLDNEWFNNIHNKLDELINLPIGWDGYKGVPISIQNSLFTIFILEYLYYEGLSLPQLVPGNDGSLQIEWHENGFDIEIDIIKPFDIHVMINHV